MVSAMTADVFDYQQWKTGKRLEGFITQFSGMLVTAAMMLFNLILPWFYEHYGLEKDYTVFVPRGGSHTYFQHHDYHHGYQLPCSSDSDSVL